MTSVSMEIERDWHLEQHSAFAYINSDWCGQHHMHLSVGRENTPSNVIRGRTSALNPRC